MFIITKAILDIETLTWEHVEGYEYSGPLELADRAAQDEAANAEKDARTVAGSYGSSAAAERSALTPFYRSEMNAQHAFSPTQLSELMNAAGAPLAGSAATAAGKAASEATRTRNTSGFSSALDQAARDRNAAMGTAGLDIGKADVTGALGLRQAGAEGMSNLFGTDVNAQLNAMGQQANDINAQVNAGKSGWFQNMLGAINTGTDLYKALFPGTQG